MELGTQLDKAWPGNDRGRGTHPEHLIFMPIKHMCHKTPMCPEPLASHHIAHTSLLLRHVADMIAIRVHYHVLVGLFKATAKRISPRTLFCSGTGARQLTS